jgi:hypothetical protein
VRRSTVAGCIYGAAAAALQEDSGGPREVPCLNELAGVSTEQIAIDAAGLARERRPEKLGQCLERVTVGVASRWIVEQRT